MTDWVVWYSDGSSFSSDDGPPHAAPRTGVICICQASPEHGHITWLGEHFYWWDPTDKCWINGDAHGLDDYLDQPGDIKIRLKGRAVMVNRYHWVCRLANEDTRLPAKTSYDVLESRVTPPRDEPPRDA